MTPKWAVDDLEADGATMRDVPEEDDGILKIARLEDETSTAAAAESTTVVKDKETEYCDALGVPPDADGKGSSVFTTSTLGSGTRTGTTPQIPSKN